MENSKEAIQLLLDTGAEIEEVKVTEIGGRYFAKQKLIEVCEEPMADPLVASTLDALITYISKCRAEMCARMMICVQSPICVTLISGLNAMRQREIMLRCQAETPKPKFDTWISQEEFMIYLASCFVDTEDRRILQKYAGTVEAKTVATYGDDGISQKATVSTGVASKAAVVLPSRVRLAPYRTFSEIQQPESEFVFRVNDQPSFRLVEADGGSWRLAAMKSIADYLSAALTDAGITDIPILR